MASSRSVGARLANLDIRIEAVVVEDKTVCDVEYVTG